MSADRYRMFAGYNVWANARLYDACAALPESEWGRDRGAFFGSLQGTLNHILIADRIWMARLDGRGPVPQRLDEVPFPDLADLRAARAVEDERIGRFVEGLGDRVEGVLTYRTMAGEPFEQPLSTVLDHLFNHQTHHRGQAHALVSQAGAEPPPLDLLYYLRETKVARPV